MAKYYGAIGFAVEVEKAPDVWVSEIVERKYSGDVIRNYPRWQNAQQVNDNVSVNNRISILADPYAISHLGAIRYVTWMGEKWKVSGFEVQPPRILLDVGELYNGGRTNE